MPAARGLNEVMVKKDPTQVRSWEWQGAGTCRTGLLILLRSSSRERGLAFQRVSDFGSEGTVWMCARI